MTRLPKRFWSKVEIRIGEPVIPEAVSGDTLGRRVLALRKDYK